jgi:oligosaccharide repeat unit polymerase
MFFLITLSLVLLYFSLLMMQKEVSVFNVRQLTVPGFFYLTYIVFTFIPSIFVALDKPSPYRETYFFATTSILLTVPLGIYAANYIFRFKKREIAVFFKKPIEGPYPSYHLRVLFALILMCVLGFVFLYLNHVDRIPLFEIIRNPGAYLESYELREKSFKLLDAPLRYILFLLRVLIFPFLTILALGYYLQTRQRIWLVFFIITLVTGTFYAALSTAKWPVVVMFLLVLLFTYIYRQGYISKTLVFLLAGLMLAFPFFVMLKITAAMDVGLLDIVNAMATRIFYDPAEGLYDYFELFPEQVDYLYGRSIGKLSWLMGWEYFNVPNYIFQYRFPGKLETGSADAGFIGGLHADFGMIGVLFGGFCVGVLLETIQINLLRKNKTIMSMSVYTFLIFAFFLLNFAALPIVLSSNGAILVLILPWLIRSLEKFLKKAVRKYEF